MPGKASCTTESPHPSPCSASFISLRNHAGVLQQLREEGIITGWRDELYPVTSGFYASPVMLIERAAATHFGIKAYGVHINGYVKVGVLGMYFTLWHHTLGQLHTGCMSMDTSRWGPIGVLGRGLGSGCCLTPWVTRVLS